MSERLSYSEQLKHPNWQRKRLKIFERDWFKCQRCGSTDKQLHAHHTFYLPGAAAWEYIDDALVTLCGDCHDAEHSEKQHFVAMMMLPMLGIGINTADRAELAIKAITGSKEVSDALAAFGAAVERFNADGAAP